MLPSPPSEMNYPPTSKRKRTDSQIEEQHEQHFTVTDLVSNIPWTFESVSRLLRAHLPLSWLAAAGSTIVNDIHPGSLVQGYIPISGSWDYAVLVARRIPNGGLVAFEKIDDQYFVVQPLQPFVSERWIQDASIGASPSVGLQMMLHYLPTPVSDEKSDPRGPPEPKLDTSLNIPKARRGAAARLSILSLPEKSEIIQSPSKEDFVMGIGDQADLDPISKAEVIRQPATSGPAEPSEIGGTSISTEIQPDMLSHGYLRQRYHDHLYTTKTSLAYYTKGPLSRARARARAPDSSMTLTDLAVFYRGSLLPVKRMDSKYKESIPQLIQNIEQHSDTSTPKTTRRTRLGKDGLWPLEPDFVLRWWRARTVKRPTSSDDQSQDTRDAIASLRMREAQMQMVLMLEALSIETKHKDTLPKPEVADVKYESVEDETLLETAKTKPKKQRNLEADLEILADRLCIWHSVGLEGSLTAVGETGGTQEDQAESKDRLRNFCADVLIPFYSSRLPVLCKSLCRTLAGPEVFEQAQKAARLKDAGKDMVPGATVRRRPLSAAGKELHRVVSGEAIRQASPPSLIRASTLPPLPKLQREASELSIRPPSRNARQASMSFVNREIDLVADAQATASKKRKLDRVASHKQDLAAAIEALKKPNRRTVSSAYMDEVERRKPDNKSESVQITATPTINRRSRLDDAGDEPLAQPVFSSSQAVPSSGTKMKTVGIASSIPRSSSKKKAVLAAIHDTPSKSLTARSDSRHGMGDSLACDESTGARLSNNGFVLSTPSKPRSRNVSSANNVSTKTSAGSSNRVKQPFALPDIALKAMDRAMTMPIASTIYDTLGWNDDDDDM